MKIYSLFTRNIHIFQRNVREPCSRGSQDILRIQGNLWSGLAKGLTSDWVLGLRVRYWMRGWLRDCLRGWEIGLVGSWRRDWVGLIFTDMF